MLYEVNHISSTVADNAHDQFTTLLNIGSFKEAAASFDELRIPMYIPCAGPKSIDVMTQHRKTLQIIDAEK
uniref:Uncharacterized protein n=1 Tax=Romanomermis culicivorax TaxID=13658 RepID=A0A915LBQ3_ROMCU